MAVIIIIKNTIYSLFPVLFGPGLCIQRFNIHGRDELIAINLSQYLFVKDIIIKFIDMSFRFTIKIFLFIFPALAVFAPVFSQNVVEYDLYVKDTLVNYSASDLMTEGNLVQALSPKVINAVKIRA